MTTIADLVEAQAIVGRTFRSISLLKLALTAAGADELIWDGNRKLAQLGERLIELLISINAFDARYPRDQVSQIVSKATSKAHRAEVANASGIARFIKYCPRQRNDPPSQTVLSLATSAVVCAAWLDCDKDYTVAWRVVLRLGLIMPLEPCLDPRELISGRRHSTPINPAFSRALSNEPLNSQSGNEEYLTIVREMIDDDLQDWTATQDTHDKIIAENLRVTEDMEAESLDNPEQETESSWCRPDQDIPMLDSERSDAAQFGNARRSRASTWRPSRQNGESSDHGQTMASVSSPGVIRSGTPSRTPPSKVIDAFQTAASGTSKRWSNASASVASKEPNVAISRSSTSRIALRLESEAASLEEYISHDQSRYIAEGSRCSDHFVGAGHSLTDPYAGNYQHILAVIQFTLGGRSSMMSLKEILRVCRDVAGTHQSLPSDISNTKRLETIRDLDGMEAYVDLLKTYHIYRLYKDNAIACGVANDRFMNITAADVTSAPSGQLGNPRNSAESKITKSIMREVYPEHESDSAVYKQKYREISSLRRSGRRYDIWISRFGSGILGLLPWVTDDSLPGRACRITQSILSSLEDEELRRISDLLSDREGVRLRQISHATEPIVKGIIHGTLDMSTRYVIETVEAERLMNVPQGSPRHFELLSPTTNV